MFGENWLFWLLLSWHLCGFLAFLQWCYDDWCYNGWLIVDGSDVLRVAWKFIIYVPFGAFSLVWVNWGW